MDLPSALFEAKERYEQLLLLFIAVCLHVCFFSSQGSNPKPHHMWKGFCLDQRSVWWDVATGNNDVVTGTGHSNEVTDMVVDGDNLISVGIDDTVRFTSVAARQFRSVVWWWQCDEDKSACMILYYHLGIPAEKKKKSKQFCVIFCCVVNHAFISTFWYSWTDQFRNIINTGQQNGIFVCQKF